MSEQSNQEDFDQLERINADLNASLKSCRAILHDCQQKLAANSNEPADGARLDDADLS